MKINYLIIFLFIYTIKSFGQYSDKFKDGETFNSVFQNIKSGKYKGTSNGIIILKNHLNKEIIFDFQGSSAELVIEEDEHEVYDVSTKKYIGKTTSGFTQVVYETYATANSFKIELNNQYFGLSGIDGACDMVIKEIDYEYKAENDSEYLILSIKKELTLDNWRFLLDTKYDKDLNNLNELKRQKQSIIILPSSIIVFAIKRK